MNILCLYSILLAFPLLDESKASDIVMALIKISDIFVTVNFLSISQRIVLFFGIAFAYAVALLFLYRRPMMMLNPAISIVVKFGIEFIIPWQADLVNSVLLRSIGDYRIGVITAWQMVWLFAAFVLTNVIYFESVQHHTMTTFYPSSFYAQWNGWNLYVKIVLPPIPLIGFAFLDVKVRDWVYITLVFVQMYAYFLWDFSLPFISPSYNVAYLFTTCFVGMTTAVYAVNYLVGGIGIVYWAASLSVLAVAAVSFAITVFNQQSNKLMKRIEVGDGDDVGQAEHCPDPGEQIYDFPMAIVDDPAAVGVLHHMLSIGGPRFTQFLFFLFENTTNDEVLMESIRFAVMLEKLTPEVCDRVLHMEKDECPKWAHQLLLDVKLEVMAKQSTYEDHYLHELAEQDKAIKTALLTVVKALQMNGQEETLCAIEAYRHACDVYETIANEAFFIAPESVPLMNQIADYYMNRRGDYLASQSWKQRSEVLESRENMKKNRNVSESAIYKCSAMRRRVTYQSIVKNQASVSTDVDPSVRSQLAIESVRSPFVVANQYLVMAFAALYFFVVISSFYLLNSSARTCYSASGVMWKLPFLWATQINSAIDFGLGIVSRDLPASYQKVSAVRDTWRYGKSNSRNSIGYLMQNLSFAASILHEQEYQLWNMIGSDNLTSTPLNPRMQMIVLNEFVEFLDRSQGSPNDETLLVDVLDKMQSVQPTQVRIIAKMVSVVSSYVSKNIRSIKVRGWIAIPSIAVVSISIAILRTVGRKIIDVKVWAVVSGIDDALLSEFYENQTNTRRNGEQDDIDILDDDEFDIEEPQAIDLALSVDEPKVMDESTELEVEKRNTTVIQTKIFIPVFLSSVIWALSFFPVVTVLKTDFNSELFMTKTMDYFRMMGHTGLACLTKYVVGSEMQEVLNQVRDVRHDYKINHVLESSAATIDAELEGVINTSALLAEFDAHFNEWEKNQSDWELLLKILEMPLIRIDAVFDTMRFVETKKRQQKIFRLKTTMTVGNIIGVLLMVVALYLGFIELFYVKSRFESQKAILKILPGQYLSATSLLASVKKETKKSTTVSETYEKRYIIRQSLDPIVIISFDQKIQDVNRATEHITGHRKNELIGMRISDLISPDNDDGFLSQLAFRCCNVEDTVMDKFNLKVMCIDGKETPCSCTLISLYASKHTHSETEPAFALILRDRTLYLNQENYLQIAQKNVETLLYRILPREMATKLLARNQELIWTAPYVTIMFISIVNFLQWCRSHTHTEIMDFLDRIFSKFDEKLSKFPTLVKLKIVNGTYMVAGGLFNEVGEGHELESVKFALKCARFIAKRNHQTSSNLALTVGINTGGPIIEGILGIDKPLFDIWGDPVNVSSRLQTCCPTNCIQMSLSTYNALPEGMFEITENPGVFLKGKGVTTTYLLKFNERNLGTSTCLY